MSCIFCGSEGPANSIEHIVSESLGNTFYTITQGKVCDNCNNRFSKFEATALANSVLVMERARLAIKSKKGKTAKGKVEGLKIEGAIDFEKNKVILSGLNDKNLTNVNPNTGIGYLYVKSFDKSESATSKLLLKMALEALYTSQRHIYNKYSLSELREFLLSNQTKDWPFITSDYQHAKFQSIPRFQDKLNLKKIRCEMLICEIDESFLLFKFKYGGIQIVINLINRNLDWIEEYLDQDNSAVLYPTHFQNKIKNKKETENKNKRGKNIS